MFSVTVPCFKPRPDWLRQTLGSVASQLRGEDELIVVDASPDHLRGPVREAAQAFGARYVEVDDRGGGAIHNDCYRIAARPYVHVLHPDDWVLNGFYPTMRKLIEEYPGRALYSVRAVWVDGDGRPFTAESPEAVVVGNQFRPLERGNPLCVAGCVAERAAVARFGGWDERLIHCNDWEFWARLTTRGSLCDLPYPLAVYRHSAENDTSRLARSGENLRDRRRLLDVCDYVAVDRPVYLEGLWEMARKQARRFADIGDEDARRMNADLAIAFSTETDHEYDGPPVDWFAPSPTYRPDLLEKMVAQEPVGVAAEVGL